MAKDDNIVREDFSEEMPFEKIYPNPIIHTNVATKIKGVSAWFVFDKSHLAEDPIIPAGWIVTKKGKKFRLDAKGAGLALKSINFVPSTEEEALEAALLPYKYSDNYKVVLEKPFSEVGVPPEIALAVEPPSVVKAGKNYKVTYCTYYYNPTIHHWYHMEERFLTRHTVEVGKDVYVSSSDTLWSLGGAVKIEKARSIPADVLRRRYGEFSTAGAFILLRIRNKETGEYADAVYENMDWYLMATRGNIIPVKGEKEYIEFMIENYDRSFDVSDADFKELIKFDAPAKEEYEAIKAKGIPYLVSSYLEKWYWNAPKNTGSYMYLIREEKYAYDESFLRVLLDMDLVVRRECESGHRYVESKEIDSALSDSLK